MGISGKKRGKCFCQTMLFSAVQKFFQKLFQLGIFFPLQTAEGLHLPVLPEGKSEKKYKKPDGYRQLTPFHGEWRGQEIEPEVDKQRSAIRKMPTDIIFKRLRSSNCSSLRLPSSRRMLVFVFLRTFRFAYANPPRFFFFYSFPEERVNPLSDNPAGTRFFRTCLFQYPSGNRFALIQARCASKSSGCIGTFSVDRCSPPASVGFFISSVTFIISLGYLSQSRSRSPDRKRSVR